MTDEELVTEAKRLGIEWVNDIRWYYATGDGHKILSAASRREVIAAIAAQGKTE